VEQQLQIQALVDRLQSTGYTHMALTHVIYGRPVSSTTNLDQTVDAADIAIPKSLYSNIAIKKQTMHILRRLHAIVETVSDVAMYHSTGNINNDNMTQQTPQQPQTQQQQQLLLRGYDLISLGPTNDATFQAACRHAMAVDIVTVDYTQRLGWKLPYQIQTQDLQALIDRGGSLEICVAPALLNVQHRKSLIHACREVLLACQSLTNLKQHHHHHQLLPPIILSSGNRTLIDNYSQNGENDAGALALRTPGDLQTLAKTLLGLPPALVGASMNTVPAQVIQHAQERRLGTSSCASIVLHHPIIQIKDNNQATKTTSKVAESTTKLETTSKIDGCISILSSRGDADPNNDDDNYGDNDNNDDDDQKDGFIVM
jgi:RNase P/RNase MRP subunit p30